MGVIHPHRQAEESTRPFSILQRSIPTSYQTTCSNSSTDRAPVFPSETLDSASLSTKAPSYGRPSDPTTLFQSLGEPYGPDQDTASALLPPLTLTPDIEKPTAAGVVLPSQAKDISSIGHLRATIRDLERFLGPQNHRHRPSLVVSSSQAITYPPLLGATSPDSVEVSKWASRIRLIDGTMNPS